MPPPDIETLFARLGHVAALDPAYAMSFLAGPRPVSRETSGLGANSVDRARDGVAVIGIEGPLGRYAWTWGGQVILDGYDRIEGAVRAATLDADAILLRLDTPGGSATGLWETTRQLRALLTETGTSVVAYADELAASAGYALASLADEIWLPPEGLVGSIGTYASHYDLSRALDRAGITVTLVRDPEGKAAGSFSKPLEGEAFAQWQEHVTEISNVFYSLVAERRGMTPEAVKALNARVFSGQKAIAAGLADHVGSFNQAYARAQELAQSRREKRMKGAHALLGLPATASAEEVDKRAAEVAPLLALGTKAHALTGEASPEASLGTITAWKKDAGDVAALRNSEAEAAAKADKDKRQALLVELCQVEPPGHVWKNPKDQAQGPVQEFAEMSTSALQAYVRRRADRPKPSALREEAAAAANAGAEPTDDEVKAYQQRHRLKTPGIARAALKREMRQAAI